jgi:hypothetical protein
MGYLRVVADILMGVVGVSRLSRDASAANRSNRTPKAMVALNFPFEITD